MPSQKSTPAPADPHAPREAVAPKRDRGRLRVSAILDAAAALFAEKGYEAATMTEIAARSATAIGSLYRFFPTKETLADALLQRYRDEIADTLVATRDDVETLGPQGLADALVSLMIESGKSRAAAVALVDVVADGDARRASLRGTMRAGLETILRAANPALAHADACATVLLALLKTVPALAAEAPRDDAPEREEIRAAIRLYVRRCARPSSGG